MAQQKSTAYQLMDGMYTQQHMLIVEPVSTILVELLTDHHGQRQWFLEEWH